MQAEDRPIHFSAELLHLPCKHEVSVLQKLYFDLSQTREAAYDNTDFSLPGRFRFFSKRGARTLSTFLFLPDRFMLAEEWVDIPLSDFLAKLERAAGLAMDALNIPFLPAHTVTLRTTFALTHYDDARRFLLDHVCHQEDRLGPYFRRPIAVGGLRLVFPETPEQPSSYNVVIESFRHSQHEVYVEVKGVFARQRVMRDGLGLVADNFRAAQGFVVDSIFPFLNQYDTAQENWA